MRARLPCVLYALHQNINRFTSEWLVSLCEARTRKRTTSALAVCQLTLTSHPRIMVANISAGIARAPRVRAASLTILLLNGHNAHAEWRDDGRHTDGEQGGAQMVVATMAMVYDDDDGAWCAAKA